MSKPFTLIAALVFFLVALVHVYRIFTDFQVILGSHTIRLGASYCGVVIRAWLATMLLRESRMA